MIRSRLHAQLTMTAATRKPLSVAQAKEWVKAYAELVAELEKARASAKLGWETARVMAEGEYVATERLATKALAELNNAPAIPEE